MSAQLERIEKELDEARVPREICIGTDSTADRVTWLIARARHRSHAASSRFTTFNVELGLLATLDGEWRTADELHDRIGYGEREDVKRALEYLWQRGLIDACNNGHRGNLYAAKAEGKA